MPHGQSRLELVIRKCDGVFEFDRAVGSESGFEERVVWKECDLILSADLMGV